MIKLGDIQELSEIFINIQETFRRCSDYLRDSFILDNSLNNIKWYRTVLNGIEQFEWYRTVLNNTERYRNLLNGTKWYQNIQVTLTIH